MVRPCPSLKAATSAFHLEGEGGKGGGFIAEKIEKVPLGHHRDERRRGVEMRQIADHVVGTRNADLCAIDAVVLAFEEFGEQPKLIKDFHCRGVHRVAAEIAEEVGMPLDHLH